MKRFAFLVTLCACADLDDSATGDPPPAPTNLANFNSRYGGSKLSMETDERSGSFSARLVPTNGGCPKFDYGLTADLNGKWIGTLYGGQTFDGTGLECEELFWYASNDELDLSTPYQTLVLDDHNGNRWTLFLGRAFADDFEIDAQEPTHVIWKSNSTAISGGKFTYKDESGASQSAQAQISGNVLIAPSPMIVDVTASDHPVLVCSGPTECAFTRTGYRAF